MQPQANNASSVDSSENSAIVEMVMNLFDPILNGNQPFFKINLTGDVLMQNKATEKIATIVLHDKTTATLQDYLKLLHSRNHSFDGFFHRSVFTPNNEEFILNFFKFPETDFLFVYCRNANHVTESEKLNLLFLKIMKQSIGYKLLTDSNFKVLWANDSFFNFSGYTLEDVIGKKGSDVFLPEYENNLDVNKIVSAVGAGKKFAASTVFFKKNHQKANVNLVGDSIKDDYGNILSYFVDIQDTTGLVQLQELLFIRNKRIELILENLHGGIMVVDEVGKIVRANKNYCLMLNSVLDPQQLIGMDREEISNNEKSLFEDEDAFVEFQNSTSINNPASSTKEFKLKDGRILAIDFIPMNLNNDFIGTLWKYSDITVQKKTEQVLIGEKNQAEEVAKAKQLFLANMSHEIRTPMNAILGLSGLLESSELNDEQLKYTKAIKTASENLLVVINDILDISKLDVDKLKIEFETFDFNQFINQVKDLLIYKIKEKGLEFDLRVSENVPPYLITDHFRLNQILLNIIGNAIKFTSRGGISLHIDAQLIDYKKTELIFEIIDTGVGIEEENLKKIFEVFSQEHANTAKKFGGSGLGLNISNKLSNLLGGNMKITSRKNHGSNVIIKIPMEIATAVEVQKLKINVDEIDISNKRVLIVEDNEFNRLVANRLLTKYKCLISEAFNGLEAIIKLDSMEYDVILMDIQMPVMNGCEAFEIIRSFKINTPIIALTANASSEEKEKCLKMGFDDYLTKPFKPEDLKLVIANVTDVNFKNNSNSPIEPVFSLAYLDQIANNNESFKLRTLRILTDELLKSIAEIANALKQEDIIKLKFIINKINPTLKNLKITKLESALNFIMELNNDVKYNDEIQNTCMFIQVVFVRIASEILEKYLKTNI